MLKLLKIIALSTISIIVASFTVSTLWGWFIVPLGLPAISLAHSYGIMIFTGVFTTQLILSLRIKAMEQYSQGDRIVIGIVSNLILLLAGLITVQFI